jgi:hypothetical protein
MQHDFILAESARYCRSQESEELTSQLATARSQHQHQQHETPKSETGRKGSRSIIQDAPVAAQEAHRNASSDEGAA